MYENDNLNPHCPEFLDGDTQWPRSVPGAITVGADACQPGYAPNTLPMARTCNVEGVWDTTGDGCLLLENYCPTIEENGVEWVATAIDGTRQGSCAPGTKPVTSNMQRSCLAGGTWAPTLSECKINYGTCPVVTTNNVIWEEASAGEQVLGTCAAGYVPKNGETLTRMCGLLGIWEYSDSECVLPNNTLNDLQKYSIIFGLVFSFVLLGALWITFAR